MSTEWKRIRVVVEVPVLGDVTERDVRFWVERAIAARESTKDQNMKKEFRCEAVGRVDVKSFAKMDAAARRSSPRAGAQLAQLAASVKLLAGRVAAIEKDRTREKLYGLPGDDK